MTSSHVECSGSVDSTFGFPPKLDQPKARKCCPLLFFPSFPLEDGVDQRNNMAPILLPCPVSGCTRNRRRLRPDVVSYSGTISAAEKCRQWRQALRQLEAGAAGVHVQLTLEAPTPKWKARLFFCAAAWELPCQSECMCHRDLDPTNLWRSFRLSFKLHPQCVPSKEAHTRGSPGSFDHKADCQNHFTPIGTSLDLWLSRSICRAFIPTVGNCPRKVRPTPSF